MSIRRTEINMKSISTRITNEDSHPPLQPVDFSYKMYKLHIPLARTALGSINMYHYLEPQVHFQVLFRLYKLK